MQEEITGAPGETPMEGSEDEHEEHEACEPTNNKESKETFGVFKNKCLAPGHHQEADERLSLGKNTYHVFNRYSD